MCAQWKKGREESDIAHILDKLEEICVRDGSSNQGGLKAGLSDSSVTFEGGAIYEFATSILYYAADFNDEVPEEMKSRFSNKALYSAAEKGTLNPETFTDALQGEEAEYLRKPIKRYTLLTTLSVRYGDHLTRASWDDCTMTFHNDRPKEIKQTPTWNRVRHKYFGKVPDKYTQVRVFVSARSHMEVADKALNFVDLIRGIWNMFHVGAKVRLISSHWSPLSKIVRGPLHVLKEEPHTYWYSANYVEPLKVAKLGKDWERLKEFEYKMRRAVRQSNYDGELRESFIRYVRALDLRDKQAAFLKLWSLLEMLTGTQKKKGVETVNRASFIFNDVDFVQQLGHHLRAYRNAHHHQGEGH